MSHCPYNPPSPTPPTTPGEEGTSTSGMSQSKEAGLLFSPRSFSLNILLTSKKQSLRETFQQLVDERTASTASSPGPSAGSPGPLPASPPPRSPQNPWETGVRAGAAAAPRGETLIS